MKSLKCVLIGDSGVGKTSLVVTYGTNKFPSPTDFVPCVSEPYHRDITVYSGETVNIGIFDIGGGEDFHRLRPINYPNTDVFLLCFSVDNRDSFSRNRRHLA